MKIACPYIALKLATGIRWADMVAFGESCVDLRLVNGIGTRIRREIETLSKASIMALFGETHSFSSEQG